MLLLVLLGAYLDAIEVKLLNLELSSLPSAALFTLFGMQLVDHGRLLLVLIIDSVMRTGAVEALLTIRVT